MRAPRVDQGVGELATGLDQECPGAHGRVADLEVQDLLGGRRPAVVASQPIEEGCEGMANDRLGEFARRVVGARAPPFLVGLQHQSAGRGDVRRRVPVQHPVKSHVQVVHRVRVAEPFRDLVRDGAVRALLQPPRAAGVRLSQQRVEIDRVRRTQLLGRLDGDRAAGGGLQAKAHDGLVYGADLLHVERAVGDALTVENEQLLQHPVDDAVGDAWRHDALDRLPDTAAAAALEKPETVRVEQCAAAFRQVDGAPGAMGASPIVDEAKQYEKLRPGAEALVHGVGVEGGILAQALVEAGERVSSARSSRLPAASRVPPRKAERPGAG